MRRPVIYFLLSIILVLHTLSWSEDVKSKVDELFLKASSGEEKYRDLVEPSKKALIEMGQEAVPYLVEKLDAQDAREILTLIEVLDKIGEPAVFPLIEALKSDNKDRVKTASRILGDIKDKRAVKPLSDLLDNPDYTVRANACASLGKIGDTTVLNEVMFLLNDSVEVVRKSAAVSLGDLNNPGAIDALIRALQDRHFSVRMTAANSLVKLGKPAVGPLLQVLQDKNDDARYLSIESLGKIKDPRAIPLLIDKLESQDWTERGFAVEALSGIGDQKGIDAIRSLETTESHLFVKRKIGESLTRLKTESGSGK
jgi:HEAT repeat protein